MILDACFEIPKLKDSILNFQKIVQCKKHGTKNVTTYKMNMIMVCDAKNG